MRKFKDFIIALVICVSQLQLALATYSPPPYSDSLPCCKPSETQWAIAPPAEAGSSSSKSSKKVKVVRRHWCKICPSDKPSSDNPTTPAAAAPTTGSSDTKPATPDYNPSSIPTTPASTPGKPKCRPRPATPSSSDPITTSMIGKQKCKVRPTAAAPQPKAPDSAPKDKATSSLSPPFNKEILDAHNKKRSEYNVNVPLAWNKTLEDAATKYARLLANNGCDGDHSPEARIQHIYGENMNFAYTSESKMTESNKAATGLQTVLDWTDQNDPQEKLREGVTNHATQVLWKKSKTVGCGRAFGKSNKFSGGSCVAVVCNYFPVGNVVGERYSD